MYASILSGLLFLAVSSLGTKAGLVRHAENVAQQGVFRCENGKVAFKSDAPLESITAKSNKLRGIIDTAKQTFAWTVEIKTFEGFNSPLQREHFNENYMESRKYQKASFAGKIIEQIDFQKNGTYTVRAKGNLNIHGVEQERIIKSQLELSGNKLRVQSTFTVPLADHDITIPKVVYQKIAEEITVTVDAELTGN
ncbi:MAG: YceI family protein [Saprospiraceae bacterium]|nr:YceI family protein [Saprospiraceae bacterium]